MGHAHGFPRKSVHAVLMPCECFLRYDPSIAVVTAAMQRLKNDWSTAVSSCSDFNRRVTWYEANSCACIRMGVTALTTSCTSRLRIGSLKNLSKLVFTVTNPDIASKRHHLQLNISSGNSKHCLPACKRRAMTCNSKFACAAHTSPEPDSTQRVTLLL